MGKEKGTGKEAAYELIVPHAVQKDIRNLPSQLQEELIVEHLPALQANPHEGSFLKGEFRGLRKYRLSFRGTEYRITYRVLEEAKTVVLVMVGSREGYYHRLRRRTK